MIPTPPKRIADERPVRRLFTVLQQLIAEFPDLEESLRYMRDACRYLAPEQEQPYWNTVASILNEKHADHPQRDLIAAIFSGVAAPSPAPESTPAPAPAVEAELRETIQATHDKWQLDWNRIYDRHKTASAYRCRPILGYPSIVEYILTALSPLLARQTEELATLRAERDQWRMSSVCREKEERIKELESALVHRNHIQATHEMQARTHREGLSALRTLVAKQRGTLLEVRSRLLGGNITHELWPLFDCALAFTLPHIADELAKARAEVERVTRENAGLSADMDHLDKQAGELAVRLANSKAEASEAFHAALAKSEAEVGRLRGALGNVDTTYYTASQQIAANRAAHSAVDLENFELKAQLTAAETRLAQAERDKGRLDWLEEVRADIHCNTQGGWWLFTRGMEVQDRASVRILIDDSMRQIRASKPETVN